MIGPKNCNDSLIVEYNWEMYYMEAIFQIGRLLPLKLPNIHNTHTYLPVYTHTDIHECG